MNDASLPDALIYRNMDQIVMIQQVDSIRQNWNIRKRWKRNREVIQRHPSDKKERYRLSDWYMRKKKCGRSIEKRLKRILLRSRVRLSIILRLSLTGDW